MEWRERFLRTLGPGFLGGVLFSDWLRLLAKHRFHISPRCWPRAISMNSQSIQNSLFARRDRKLLVSAPHTLDIPPPLFIIGHWRSGTTHLHNLLALDDRFAVPNNYQALFPNSFLTAESLHSKALEYFLPKRRPMDNIEWNMQSAQEDEFALCILTFLSPCMGWVFPHRKQEYEKYLTFREASAIEIDRWKAAFVSYLQKLTWKHRRPLVLKSPPHTARIRVLLEMFPKAKFLHIHRDPFTVFSSTRRMLLKNATLHCLQRGGWDDIDKYVIRLYQKMHAAFFEDRKQIPAGALHEIAFDALERDPIGELVRAYRALDLPHFDVAMPAVRHYVNSIVGYEKNTYSDLPREMKQRLVREWRPSFEEWGYRSTFE